MSRDPLTPNQAKAYQMVLDGIEDGKVPTLQEMAEQRGVCRATMSLHISSLIDKRYIDRPEPYKARNLIVLPPVDTRYTRLCIKQNDAQGLLLALKRILDQPIDRDLKGMILMDQGDPLTKARNVVERIEGERLR